MEDEIIKLGSSVKLRSNEKRHQLTRPHHHPDESLSDYKMRAREVRNNMRELRDKVDELKVENPEIVTCIAYGSQVKSRAKLEGESLKPSDFDGTIILNADKLPGNLDWAHDEVESRESEDNGFFSMEAPANVAEYYKNLFVNKAKGVFPSYDIQKVLLVNDKIIAKAVNSIVEENSPGSFRSEQFANTLIPLFGLSLHPDINHYRSIVFNEIELQTQEQNTFKEQHKETWGIGDTTQEMYTKGKPVSPDRYWQDIATAMKSWDTDTRPGKITNVPDAAYPQTIAEARKLFT